MSRSSMRRPSVAALLALLCGCTATQGVARIRADAIKLAPALRTDLARRYVAGAPRLPPVKTRIVYRTPDRTRAFDEAEAAALPASDRAALRRFVADEEFQYAGQWGSPLAYALPLEVLGANGVSEFINWRVLDFGYGDLGHLQLFAAMGAEAVGVDVDPLLPLLYGTRQGAFEPGRVALVDGRWPADSAVRAAAAGPFDLIISKNVLKNGFIHPAEPLPPQRRVDLGVDEEGFVRAVWEALRPGGRFLIYNICPAPAPPGKPYIPWADGHSPFNCDQFEKVGFVVKSFDVDDSANARALAHTLGWDQPPEPMDIQNDLFALYTLVEKPR